MSSLQWKKRKIKQAFIFGCLIVFFIMATIQLKLDLKNDKLEDVVVESIDDAIKVSWEAPLLTNIRNVTIRITNSSGEICEEEKISPLRHSYVYKNGALNKRYTINVFTEYKNGEIEDYTTVDRLLMDMDDLPDLPILYITTKSGNNPASDYIEAPEGMWGATAVNNESETGILVYKPKKSDNGRLIESSITISVRGNTSSITEKKPYKIVLDRAVDLIGTENSCAHKEWLLLNTGTTINNYMGQKLSEYCEMEWVAQERYVNVFLNGDWRGVYTLIEPVSPEVSHELVSQNGYIIENDAYWWNSNGIYFRLENQIEQMGYTFKYPKIKTVDDDGFKKINNLMQNVVDMCNNNDSTAWEYADLETFTSWLMVHDIAQWGDGGGSNIYYYINDFSSVDQEKRKIKMGPVWDCDAAFNGRTFFEEHGLSSQHYSNVFPFVDNEDFAEKYREKWCELSDGIVPVLTTQFNNLYEEEGEAINQSRALDMERWGYELEYPLIEDEITVAIEWLTDQVKYLDEQFGE